MAKMYTLVRHSAYVVAGNPEFEKAVEEASVDKKADQTRVLKAGGLLFETYKEAFDRSFDENYPPDVNGLIPRCRGMFSKSKVDGAEIYIPAKEKVDAGVSA